MYLESTIFIVNRDFGGASIKIATQQSEVSTVHLNMTKQEQRKRTLHKILLRDNCRRGSLFDHYSMDFCGKVMKGVLHSARAITVANSTSYILLSV